MSLIFIKFAVGYNCSQPNVESLTRISRLLQVELSDIIIVDTFEVKI